VKRLYLERDDHMGIFKSNLKLNLDKLLSIKNNYFLWKHLIPFLIASLLLLILQIAQDDLLIKLSNAFKNPSAIWLPALALTVGSMIIYYYTVKVQIQKSYFWPKEDRCRAIGTSSFYTILCTFAAYLLFIVTQDPLITSEGYLEYLKFQQDIGSALSNFWACLLLAVLSLTGIGWSGLGNWVDAVVKNPDYTDGRKSAERITEIVKGIQNNTFSGCLSEYTCLDDFKTEIDNLYKSIDDNLKLDRSL
jgi:hypothetical protein